MRAAQFASAALTTLAALAALASCGAPTESGDEAVREVARIDVAPPAPTVGVGAAVPLAATVLDARGTIIADRGVFWASRDTTIATVSPLGVVTGRTPGSVEVAASAGGRHGIAFVTVTPKAVASVMVLPEAAETVVGGATQLQAATYDNTGAPLTGRLVLWSSSNTAVATVDTTGLVTGRAVGTVTISATSEGKSGSSTVRVNPAVGRVDVIPSSRDIDVGGTVQLVAIVYDINGAVIPAPPCSWTTSDARIATVSSSGLVRGVRRGTVTITGTCGGKSDTSRIKVE
jgi:uncharacterized protein YjdB